MEAHLFLIFAVILAGVTVALVSVLLALRINRIAIQFKTKEQPVRAYALWRLRNGFPSFRKVSKALLKISLINKVTERACVSLKIQGISTAPKQLLSILLGAVVTVFFVAGLLSQSMFCAVASSSLLLGILCFIGEVAHEKTKVRVTESIPDALASFSDSIMAGYTLQQTFEQAMRDVTPPLDAVFEQAAVTLKTGGSVSEALASIRKSEFAEDLRFLLISLDIHHQMGGSLAPTLKSAKASVENNLEVTRSLHVQTAQARLSARIVLILPFVLLAVLAIANPDFLQNFFTSLSGVALLVLVFLLQTVGGILVHRACEVVQ